MKSNKTDSLLQSILARLRGLVLNVAKSYGGLQGSLKSPKLRLVPRLASHPSLLVNTIGSLIGINRQRETEEAAGQVSPIEVGVPADRASHDIRKPASAIPPSTMSLKRGQLENVHLPIQKAGTKELQPQLGRHFPMPQQLGIGRALQRGSGQTPSIQRLRHAMTVSEFALHVQQTRDFLAKSFVISTERLSRIGTLNSAISENHQKASALSLGSAESLQATRVDLESRPSAILPQRTQKPLDGLQVQKISEINRDENSNGPLGARSAPSNSSDIRLSSVPGSRTGLVSQTQLGHTVGGTSVGVREGTQERGSAASVSVPFVATVFASFIQRKLIIGDRRLTPPASTVTLQAPSVTVNPTTTSAIAETDNDAAGLRTSEFLPHKSARNSKSQDVTASRLFTPDSRSETNGGTGGFSMASVAFAGQKQLVKPLENLQRALLSINPRIHWNAAPNLSPRTGLETVGREGKPFSHRTDSNSIPTKVEKTPTQPLADQSALTSASDSEKGPITVGSSTYQSADNSISGGLANKSTLTLSVAAMMNYSLGMVRALSIRGASTVPTPKVPIELASSAPVASRSLGKLVTAHSDLEAARTRLQLSNRTRPDWPALPNLPQDLLDPESNDRYSTGKSNLSAQEMLPRLSDPTIFQPYVALPEHPTEFEERPLSRLDSSFEETDELRSRIARILAQEARRYLGDE